MTYYLPLSEPIGKSILQPKRRRARLEKGRLELVAKERLPTSSRNCCLHLGELFGMGQSQANEWIHDVLPILKQALDDLGFLPE